MERFAAFGDLIVRCTLGADGPADFGATVTSASLPQRFGEYDVAQHDWVQTTWPISSA